ncbi:MAG TPA: TetR/AcrR family transcriptional regulator [Caulobacteraceae bacterium]|nr:TetR/AcrR family transcriptional regulator [Caulobacteraceae bacterium]
MISRDEQRARVVDQLAAHLLRTGLADASLRQLAGAAGVSDRMLLYYFSDKAEVLAAALERVAAQLAGRLEAAVPAGTVLPASKLIAVAAVLTTEDEMRPYMRLWIEVVAAAARGEAPFVEIARQIAAGFMQWIEARLVPGQPDDPEARQAAAAAILAAIDGLALLEVCAGGDLTKSAAQTMGTLLRD